MAPPIKTMTAKIKKASGNGRLKRRENFLKLKKDEADGDHSFLMINSEATQTASATA